jgi:hypothetical protein
LLLLVAVALFQRAEELSLEIGQPRDVLVTTSAAARRHCWEPEGVFHKIVWGGLLVEAHEFVRGTFTVSSNGSVRDYR